MTEITAKQQMNLIENLMVMVMAKKIKSADYQPDTLWKMVCDDFGLEYDDEEFGSMFDTIWEELYIKTDILSLGFNKVYELAKQLTNK
jgi:hypothetical protein